MSRYLPLLAAIDEWQREARQAHPGVIPCHKGCSACCHGLFDIGAADAELVVNAVAGLDPATADLVRNRAGEQLALILAREPDWQPPFDVADFDEARFDRLCDDFATLPCPLLDRDGGCLVYADRPQICRLMGLALEGESGGQIPNTCPIQDLHPAYAALAPRPFPLERWVPVEDLANREATERLFGNGENGPADYETIIAAAIVLFGSGTGDEP